MIRVINEVHSSVTKKNKEWKKKLPLVVLRAEEIMYSKANSEGFLVSFSVLHLLFLVVPSVIFCFVLLKVEYMNLDTLWDNK